MEDETRLLIVVALMVAVGAAGLLLGRSERRRSDAESAWAARHGFRRARKDETVAGMSTLEPFGRGQGPAGFRVFRGTYRDAHLVFFQYHYKTLAAVGGAARHQVVAIGLPAPRPLLDVRPRRRTGKFPARGVDFGDPRFGAAFEVESPDPRFAHDVMQARTREWVLADPRARSRRWRIEGPWLMAIRPGKLRIEEAFADADFLLDVYAQVPRHVWAEQQRYP